MPLIRAYHSHQLLCYFGSYGMSETHGASLYSCGELHWFDYIIGITLRFLLHEDSCMLHVLSMFFIQFIASVQVAY